MAQRTGRLTRLRQLTDAQQRRLAGLGRLADLLDNALPVPGTSYRIGLDPLLGLIPGLGDLVSPLFTAAILLHAREMGVPKVVQARMLINAALDALVGAVPLAGDLFDFAWKANRRNLELLELHAREERSASAADWAFVVLMIALVAVAAAVPFLLLAWLVSAARAALF